MIHDVVGSCHFDYGGGYGDIFPITLMGKIFGSIAAIFGVGLFAIPAGLLASGFSDYGETVNKNCPHCGKEI